MPITAGKNSYGEETACQPAGSIFARKFFYKRVEKLFSPQGKIPLFLVPEPGEEKRESLRVLARHEDMIE